MLSGLATTHDKVKISLIRTVSVCLLLCGAVITGQQRDQKTDGPMSVNLGDVVDKGKIKIDAADLTTLPALPRGYLAMPSMAYRITTEATAVGPFTVVFGVHSVSDEQTFNKLRVFHAEPDEFDPDSAVWVDRTASDPEASAPDFAHRTITAYSDQLEGGIYVIAKLTEELSPTTLIADLEVLASPAPKVVQMPAHITTSVIVKNNGPETDTDVGFKQQIPRGPVVSMEASQGTCKWKPRPGWVYCKLGQLPAGGSATISVVIDPGPDFGGEYHSAVEVAGKNNDSNPENNQGVATADTLADPNLPPEVTLDAFIGRQESIYGEQLFERGETLIFKAIANDPDGSVSAVEFLDNDKSLGIGSTTDGEHFSLSSNELANGRHVLNAIAVDNAGRRTRSKAQHVFVNGQAKVQILKPEMKSQLAEGSELILTAVATHPTSSITKVEFFYNGGFSLGQAAPIGNNSYTIKIASLVKTDYSIEAIATDQMGLVSKSSALRFSVR